MPIKKSRPEFLPQKVPSFTPLVENAEILYFQTTKRQSTEFLHAEIFGQDFLEGTSSPYNKLHSKCP